MSGIALNAALPSVGRAAALAAAAPEASGFADVLGVVDRQDASAPPPAAGPAANCPPPPPVGEFAPIRLTLGFPISRPAATPSLASAPTSIGATLAALAGSSAPSGGGVASPRSKTTAGGSGPAASTPPGSAFLAPVAPIAIAAASPRLDLPATTTLHPGNPPLSAQSPLAASETGPAAWDLSGAVPLRNLLASDPTLGLQSFQPRTHLAIANAIPGPASAGDDAPRAFASGGGAPVEAVDEAATVGEVDLASRTAVTPTLDDAAPGPIGLAQLPQFVADQASEFAPASAPVPVIVTPRAPSVVKELEVALNPAELGAVTLKLRFANGKLSVVIAASNPSTVAAIEGQRDAIADRLSASRLAPEDLVIQPQAAATQNPEGADAADSQSSQSSQGGRSNGARDRGASPAGLGPPSGENVAAGGDCGHLMV